MMMTVATTSNTRTTTPPMTPPTIGPMLTPLLTPPLPVWEVTNVALCKKNYPKKKVILYTYVHVQLPTSYSTNIIIQIIVTSTERQLLKQGILGEFDFQLTH